MYHCTMLPHDKLNCSNYCFFSSGSTASSSSSSYMQMSIAEYKYKCCSSWGSLFQQQLQQWQ